MADLQNPSHSSSHRARVLRHEIITLLCVKAIALTLIYLVFFGPSARPEITAPTTTAHLLAPARAQTH
ncbi:MAG: hypothetical protein KGR48_08130 [Alphaproteobacteria bacterium]|nr:hypothetical protein [Alphaproteobacteria bacterium]MBU6473709.1 hypothetical protein [Alphaproteobacteria bacterium]MDE2011624.1 hypothetical protein [Alphaproteobacteria bacterium]MDE2073844.1 hypothetical protein [Alphaproteobacteria bacterium]